MRSKIISDTKVERNNLEFLRTLPPLWDEYLHQDYVQKIVDICFEMTDEARLDKKESNNSTERQYTYARDEGGDSVPQWSPVKVHERPKSVPVSVKKTLKPPNPPVQPPKMSPVKPKHIANVPQKKAPPRTRISRFVGNPKLIDFKRDHPDLRLIESKESLFPCRSAHVEKTTPVEGVGKPPEVHQTWHEMLTKKSALPVHYVQELDTVTEDKRQPQSTEDKRQPQPTEDKRQPQPTEDKRQPQPTEDIREEVATERQRLILRDQPRGPKVFEPLSNEDEMKNLKIVNLPIMYIPRPCSVQKVLQLSISGKKVCNVGNVQYSEVKHSSSSVSNSSPKDISEAPKAEYESDFESNHNSEKSVSSKSRKTNRFVVPFLGSGRAIGNTTEPNSDVSSSEKTKDEHSSKSSKLLSKGSKKSQTKQNQATKVRHESESNSANTSNISRTSFEIQNDSESTSYTSKSSKSTSHSYSDSTSKILSRSRSVDEAEKSIDYGNVSSNTDEIFGLIRDCLSAGCLQKEKLLNSAFDVSSSEGNNQCENNYNQTNVAEKDNETCIHSMLQKICKDSPPSFRLHNIHFDEAAGGATSQECLSLEKMMKEKLNFKEYETVQSLSEKQEEESLMKCGNRSEQTDTDKRKPQDRSMQTDEEPICALQNRSVQTATNKGIQTEPNISDSLSCYCKDSLQGKCDYKDYTLFSTSWNGKESKLSGCIKNALRPKFVLEDETEDEMSSFSFDSNSKTAELDKNSNIDSESPPSSLSLGSSYFSCLSPDGSLKLSYLSSSLSFSDLSSSLSDSSKEKESPGSSRKAS